MMTISTSGTVRIFGALLSLFRILSRGNETCLERWLLARHVLQLNAHPTMEMLTSRLSTGWGEEGFEVSTLNLAEDEKVVKIETKAFKPPENELLIQGVKLTTTKGQVWKSSEYDKLSNDMIVSEDAPGRGWYLKGFYGALGDFVDRLGPVWGKQNNHSSG